MNFKEELTNRVQQIEEIIFSMLPREEGLQKQVIEAMRYSVMAGGKRLRPMLMWEAYRSFGKEDEKVYPFMAALEYIHNYFYS